MALIDSLTGRARQALPYIQSLVNTTRSANEILTELTNLGFGIRRQTGLDIIGALRGKFTTQRASRLFGQNTPLPSDIYSQSPYNIRKNYNFRVKLTGAPAGEQQFINIVSDTELSLNAIFAQADTYLNQYKDAGEASFGGSDVSYSLDAAEFGPDSTQAFTGGFGGFE